MRPEKARFLKLEDLLEIGILDTEDQYFTRWEKNREGQDYDFTLMGWKAHDAAYFRTDEGYSSFITKEDIEEYAPFSWNDVLKYAGLKLSPIKKRLNNRHKQLIEESIRMGWAVPPKWEGD